MSGSKKCLAILAEGAEELELVAPVDILRRAGFDVTVAGLNGSGPVKCSRNVVICADVSLSDVVSNDYDVVIIPGGGDGVKNLKKSELVKNVLKKQEESGRIIAAICAGPTVLKEFSVALNKKITSYPSTKDQLSDGSYVYSDDKTVVDDGITGMIFQKGVCELYCHTVYINRVIRLPQKKRLWTTPVYTSNQTKMKYVRLKMRVDWNECKGPVTYTHFTCTNDVPILRNVITSQGPGTAVEFGLAIVEKVLGAERRSKIAKELIH